MAKELILPTTLIIIVLCSQLVANFGLIWSTLAEHTTSASIF